MKGLLKYLSPFAPDQSGATAVFYELGGMIVICDAGGCTGNICGFDEPRWFQGKSALFSAGLRDMDAILGRDDKLVAKLKDAAARLDGKFAVLVGTPVPTVIATDFQALKRMASKRCGIPVLTVACTGTRLYDEGEEEAYLELFRTFAGKSELGSGQVSESRGKDLPTDNGRQSESEKVVGVIGMTPLDVSDLRANEIIEKRLKAQGADEVYCYGMGAGIGAGLPAALDAVKKAGTVTKNLVVSPAGQKAAKYLEETFGTPYEAAFPFLKEDFKEKLHTLFGKKILIIHQQAAANEIRKEIRQAMGEESNIVCGTWFLQIPEWSEPQDKHFEREEEFISYVEQENFDVIIGDRMFQRALGGWNGEFIHIPHFAVSGLLFTDVGI